MYRLSRRDFLLTHIAGGQQFINRYEVYVKINIADY